MSKELERAVDGCTIATQGNILSDVICGQMLNTRISVCEVCETDSMDNESGVVQNKEDIIKFIQDHRDVSVLVFTDGSVYGGPVGCGACAAVLFPLSDSANWLTLTSPVGKRVNSVCCEIEEIILGMEVATTYFSQCSSRKPTEYVYVFCDCLEAIEIIVNKLESHKYPNIVKKVLCIEKQLQDMSVFVKLVRITGHSGVFGNDIADQEARDAAQNIMRGKVSASEVLSVNGAYKIAKDILQKSWQRNGTKNLLDAIPTICFLLCVKKLHFPEVVMLVYHTVGCYSMIPF